MRRLLRPTNEYGAEALLPGDPQVALELAQALLERPLMANHARGLWGYSGSEPSGGERLLSIQSTGYGGQSAAAVVDQLADLGLERAIRLGTCLAKDDTLTVGQAVLVSEAIAADGTALAGAPNISEALLELVPAVSPAAVASVDVVAAARGRTARAAVVDGATAGLFAAAAERGVAIGALLVVVEAGGGELGDDETRGALVELGRSAVAALARSRSADVVYVGRVKQP